MNRDFQIDRLVRTNVAHMKAYSSARDEFAKDASGMIHLDANENPFENGLNRYPDPLQRQLKDLICRGKGVSAQQLILGNGSDEVLDLLFRAFCEPGKDNIISLIPSYGMYKVLAQLNDIEEREVLLTGEFQPDVSAILESADSRSKLLFLCSPNNPTGNSFSEEAVRELLTRFRGLVIVDEAYIDFSPDSSWRTALSTYPNLVVVQTLSKAYGMAGIRLGMAWASEEIIRILNKIKPPYNVNELTQQKAMERLEERAVVEQEIAVIVEQRSWLLEKFQELEIVEKVFPTDANFILVRVDDAGRRYQQLLQEGIVVRNRHSQPLCENCLRFSVGTPEENQKLIKTLKSIDK